MNPPDISAGELLLFMIVVLATMVIFPFAKAGLLYGAIRILRFQVVSYWKSLFCVLIGLGALMAVEMVLLGLSMQAGKEFDPQALQGAVAISLLLGLFLTPIAEFISLLLFFKESAGRTLGAIALHYLFCIVAGIVLFLCFVGISMLGALIIG